MKVNKKKYFLALVGLFLIVVICYWHYARNVRKQQDAYMHIDHNKIIKRIGKYKNVNYRKLNNDISDVNLDEEMFRELDIQGYLETTSKSKAKIVSAELFVTDREGVERFREYKTYFYMGKSWLGKEFDKIFLQNEIKDEEIIDLNFLNNYFKDARVRLKNIKYFKNVNVEKILSQNPNEHISLDEYRKNLSTTAKERNGMLLETLQENEIFQKIYDDTQFKKIPEKYIKNYIEQMQIHCGLKNNKDIRNIAIKTIKENAIRFAVFDNEKMKIPKSEYDEFLKKQYQPYADEFKSISGFEEEYSKIMLYDNFRKEKTNNYIIRNAIGVQKNE